VPLEFEPRARADIGFVFLAAQPAQGRSLRPALRFHLSKSLPVYSTSDIFEGDANANADLEGIIFPDMPWVISPDEISTQLRSTIAGYWPGRARGRARLYAFGFDAYRLVPALKAEKIDPLATVPGLTGRLSVDAQGKIRRQLDWAQIIDGKAEPDAKARALDATGTSAAAER
jgi:outer membrane PBP1 activator LpoA protein